MKPVLFFVICCFLFSFLRAQTTNYIPDLPRNPQAGHCYVRCYTADDEKGEWKDIACALVEYQELEVLGSTTLSKGDKKILDKVFRSFIKKGYTLQLDSYYTSNKSIEENIIQSRERAITVANYLVHKGLAPEHLRVNAMGSTNEKTGFWYRAINGVSDKWKYLEKEGIWCKTGD